jgi:hypothetical protein
MAKELDLESEMQPLPHPFHSREVRGRGRREEAEVADDDEDKKARWAKIIAYILKYHTLPSVKTERELADSATIATLLNESRIHVEPSWTFFPVPHPTLQFNGYSVKKGPTIIAKNGAPLCLCEAVIVHKLTFSRLDKVLSTSSVPCFSLLSRL